MEWGFIPQWSDPSKAKFKPINARADKLSGGYYKEAFTNSRCLIPTSHFYEWKRVTVDKKEIKQPYLFKMKKKKVFAMAGLFAKHIGAEGKVHYMAAIITTGPNSLMKKVHNRMPVIIAETDYEKFFESDFDEAVKLLKPFKSSLMESYRVSKDLTKKSLT